VDPEILSLKEAVEYIKKPRPGKSSRPLFNKDLNKELNKENIEPEKEKPQPKKGKKRSSKEAENIEEEDRIPSPFLSAHEDDTGSVKSQIYHFPGVHSSMFRKELSPTR